MKRLVIWLAALGAGAVLALSACGSGGAQDTSTQSGATTKAILGSHPITITVYPEGPHGEHVSPANFAVQPGVPVTITVVNHTLQPHTLTVPDIGFGVFIRPGAKGAPSTTRFAFTSDKQGVFRWKCVFCGRHMSGQIYAIIG